MFIRRLFITLLFSSSTALVAQEAPLPVDHLIVEVKTKKPTLSLLISSVEGASSSISNHVRDTLTYDFAYGGFATLVESTKSTQSACHTDPIGTLVSSKAYYLLSLSISDKGLRSKVYKAHEALPVIDRTLTLGATLPIITKQLHQLSDTLHKELYGHEGISRYPLLYTTQKQRSTFQSAIAMKCLDTEDPRIVSSDASYIVNAQFIPTQSQNLPTEYICVEYGKSQPKIMKGSLLKDEHSQLIPLVGSQMLPAISRNGSMIAFISDITGKADLFLYPLGTTSSKPIQLFSPKKGVCSSPSISPSGGHIAFVHDETGTPKIYLLDLSAVLRREKNQKVELLTPYFGGCTSPSFSPDNTQIAYSAKINGFRQIVVYNIEKKTHSIITNGDVHKENPTWAPNSMHIAYNTTGTSSHIFVTNTRTNNEIQLTTGKSINHYPSWIQTKQRD